MEGSTLAGTLPGTEGSLLAGTRRGMEGSMRSGPPTRASPPAGRRSTRGASSAEACHVIGKVHFDEALSFARKSVSEADVKKFENFRESLAARKG